MEGFLISLICSSLINSSDEGQACLKGSEAAIIQTGLQRNLRTVEVKANKFVMSNVNERAALVLGTAYTIQQQNGISYELMGPKDKFTVSAIIGVNTFNLKYVYNF